LVNVTSNTTQALILAPTHELAKQIAGVTEGIGGFMDGLRIKTIVGGTSIQADVEDMRENVPHVIVGCAGRIYDMIRRRHIDTSHIRLLVLDEADEMLSRGFKPQVYMIFQQLREDIQVALFSATLPEEIVEITQKFMRNPAEIRMKQEELSLECIQQTFVALADDRAKYEMLKDIFATICVNQCIIYCNSVNRVVDLYQAMTDEGFSVCAIHSSMDKAARESVFTQFRTGTFRVLISSNITARGIDVQQVSTVVNFDIPKCVHTYLHRIGRSGRWGRKGLAINFVTRRDIPAMRNIENHYKISMEELSR
jgi:translation initiation factor 4A